MSLPRPPVINQVLQESGLIDGEWNRWFNAIYNLLSEAIVNAPSDAPYILQTLNELLPNAQALGNLSTGFAKVTHVTGLITTQATIQATDLENSGVTSGIYGDSTHIAQVTVNAQGLVTNASSITVSGAPPTGVASGALSGNYPNPQLATQTQALNMGTNLINNVVDPVSAQDAATKQYVDTAVSALGQIINVKAATTAALSGSPIYSNGVAGVGATLTIVGTLITIDSIAITLNSNYLIKNQASAFQNGVYTATAVDGTAHNYTFTRALDYDTPGEMNNTTAIAVLQGTTNTGSQFALSSPITTIGVDSLTYTAFYFSTIDSLITFQDITTGNANSTQHGFLKKLSTANKILYTDGTNQQWSTPTFPVTASATSGKVMISDGTNWVASPETFAAPGTSGNVMTSDGTNWTSSAPSSSGGAMVLISRQTASASASIDFTSINSGIYDHYVIYCSNILLATLGNLLLRYSIAGSFKSDAGYSDQAIRTTFNSSGSSGSIATDTGMPINSTSEPIGTTTGTSAFDAIIHIGNCAQTTDKKRSMWQSTYKSSNNITITNMGGGWYNTNATAAIDGFRLIADSGNIASGTIALWGIKNS